MKKIIRIFITVISLLLVSQMITFAQNDALKSEEIGLLKAISFMDDAGFSENEYLTRGEFSYMIKKIFKYDYYGEEVPFRDIDTTHPYYDSIAICYSKGIVHGMNKYTVSPNKEITLGEAEQMAVRALGYNIFPDSGNTTYSSQARQLGLDKGISLAEDDYLTEEAALRVVYNILFAPIMGYQYGGKELDYIFDKDIIMMNEIYDMYEVKGIITENSITSLYGESNLREKRIRLGEEVYETDMQDVDDLLGYSVKAYLVEDKLLDEMKLLYAYKDEKKNKELVIMSEDISEATKNTIKYYVENKEKKADVSTVADVIYNGIGIDSFEDTVLKPKYGILKLIDNDKDGEYDVIFVQSFSLMVVQNISTNENLLNIGEKFGNHLKVDLSNDDCTVVVYRGNNEATFNDIKTGSVLLLEDSGERISSRLIKLHLCTETVSGVLTSTNDEEITIDTKTYPVSAFLDVAKALNAASRNVTVHIDKYGNAVYIENAAGNIEYGFLFRAFLEETFDETVMVKILDTNNEWHTYTLKEKISSNGTRKKAIDFYNSMLIIDSSGRNAIKKQLVRYAVNSEGLITTLDIAEDGTISAQKHDALIDKQIFRISFEKKNRRYAHNTKGLFVGGGYSQFLECFFTGTIPVLIRPDTDEMSQDEVMFTTQTYFKTDGDYITEGYDVDEENYVKVIIVYKEVEPTIGLGDKIYVIDNMKTELNEDDEVENVCYAWQGGSLKRLVPADGKNPFEGLKKGDVVRFKLSPFDGKIDSVENGRPRFRVDDNPEQYFTDPTASGDRTDAYAYDQQMVGRVVKVYGDYVRLQGSSEYEYFNMYLGNSATKYITYDTMNPRSPLNLGTKNDIGLGDIIVSQMYFGRLETVVIYK